MLIRWLELKGELGGRKMEPKCTGSRGWEEKKGEQRRKTSLAWMVAGICCFVRLYFYLDQSGCL